MKSVFIIFMLFVTSIFSTSANEGYDILFSTADNANGTINVEKTAISKNAFSIILNINWVDAKLRSKAMPEAQLCFDAEAFVKTLPTDITLLEKESRLISNRKIELKLRINGTFQGGKVDFSLPFYYAENLAKAQKKDFTKILFRQPKVLKTSVEINASDLEDITAPTITLLSPISRGFKQKAKDTSLVVSTKSVMVKAAVKDNKDLAFVKINNQRISPDYEGNFSNLVVLKTGDNPVRVVAADKSGNMSEITLEFICTYQYDIQINEGKYFALLIAAQDYESAEIPRLSNPVKDAEALKKVLTERYNFEDKNVILAKNPTRQDLLMKFEYLSEMVGENDNVVIFYAGHGIWDDKKSIGYWLPVDAHKISKANWLNNSTIKDYINAIESKHTLLISDACFSGSIFRSRAVTGSVTAYNKLYNLPSRKGMTSGTLKEVPDESVFIKYLLKRLNDNENKYLPAETLFSNMRNAVLNNSQNVPQYGTIQGTGDEGGEFIFIRR